MRKLENFETYEEMKIFHELESFRKFYFFYPFYISVGEMKERVGNLQVYNIVSAIASYCGIIRQLLDICALVGFFHDKQICEI